MTTPRFTTEKFARFAFLVSLGVQITRSECLGTGDAPYIPKSFR